MLSAAFSMFHAKAEALPKQNLTLDDLLNPDKEDALEKFRGKIIRNVAKISPSGDVKYIAGHRSHRSHSSHRSGGSGRSGGHYSHASHMSGYSGGSSYGSSSSRRSSSRPSTVYSAPKPPKKTPATYSLGDRALKSGLYGADVTELTNLLVRKKYMRTEWISQQSGYSLYDSNVVNAVKRFQKDAGLSQTGNVTKDIASKLQYWDESKTTLLLGVRNLTYNEDAEISGKDVDELVTLLRNAGFPPDPSKLVYNGSNLVFTKDIETAVRMFQAYNQLGVTGVVAEETLKKLRSLAK